jgi:hypothetical protein
MVTCLAYCVDRELWKAIEHPKKQVRVPKEQQGKDEPAVLSSHQSRVPTNRQTFNQDYFQPDDLNYPHFSRLTGVSKRPSSCESDGAVSKWRVCQGKLL